MSEVREALARWILRVLSFGGRPILVRNYRSNCGGASRLGHPSNPTCAHHVPRIAKLILDVVVLLFLIVGSAYAEKPVIRLGYFATILHAQAVVGRAKGDFEKKFGPEVELDWKIFNAGPSAIEAFFANHLDIAYVGPSPTINGYVKSNGEAIRVVAGAASGGAGLVVREDAGISSVKDFHGKKIASPQMGNTQDVTLRAWLKNEGLVLKDTGGDVQVIPLSNADQQTLFLKKEIDAAWTVEPWVSMLVLNAHGKIFFEESTLWEGGDYATALVVVRNKFLDEHPELVRKFLEVHKEVTDFLQKNPAEAKKIFLEEVQKETQKKFSPEVVDQAFSRVRYTCDPLQKSVRRQAQMAFAAGFLKKKPDLTGLFDLAVIKELAKEKCCSE